MSASRYTYPPRLREALSQVYEKQDVALLYEAFGGATADVNLDQAPSRIWDEILTGMPPVRHGEFVGFLLGHARATGHDALTRELNAVRSEIAVAADEQLRRLLVHHPLRHADEITDQRDVGIDPSPVADRFRRGKPGPRMSAATSMRSSTRHSARTHSSCSRAARRRASRAPCSRRSAACRNGR